MASRTRTQQSITLSANDLDQLHELCDQVEQAATGLTDLRTAFLETMYDMDGGDRAMVSLRYDGGAWNVTIVVTDDGQE